MSKKRIQLKNDLSIFIDSNVFLTAIKLTESEFSSFLDEIYENKKHLIFTEQNVDEILRNISEILSSDDNFLVKKNYLNLEEYVIDNSRDIKEEGLKEEYKNVVSKVNKSQGLKNKSLKDSLFNNSKKLEDYISKLKENGYAVLPKTSEIIKKAHERKLCGNPPKSDSRTIGDEIIWETLLDCAKSDLVIVSEDNTFTTFKNFLQRECSKRGFNLINVFKTVKEAFHLVGYSSQSLENLSDSLREFAEQTKEIIEAINKAFEPIAIMWKDFKIPNINIPIENAVNISDIFKKSLPIYEINTFNLTDSKDEKNKKDEEKVNE